MYKNFSYPRKVIHVAAYIEEQVFKKSGNQLKILGARRAIWNALHTEDPQVSGATTQNSVSRATWSPEDHASLSILA